MHLLVRPPAAVARVLDKLGTALLGCGLRAFSAEVKPPPRSVTARRSAAKAAAELDARALLQLLPEDSVCKHALAAEQQQRCQQEQQCAHSAAGVSSTASGGSAAESSSSAAGSGGGRRGRGEGRLSSPTAIASPRAPSLSTATTRSLGSPPDTAAATPEACAGLAQASADGAHSAHASASMPSTPRTALTPASSFSLGEGGLQERGGVGGPDLRFVIQRLRAPHVTGQVGRACTEVWGREQRAEQCSAASIRCTVCLHLHHTVHNQPHP